MIKNLKYFSSLERKQTQKSIIWEIIHNAVIAMPSGLLLIIIWELFSEEPNKTLMFSIVGIMLLLLIIQMFIASKSMVTTNIWTYSTSNKLRLLLGNHLQKISLGFFKKRDLGEIASVILQDVANFEGAFGHSAGNAATSIFNTIIVFIFLFFFDWRLALCLLVVLPLIIPFLWIANYFVSKLGKEQISLRNKVGAQFLEYVQGIRHLKSYGLTGQRHKILDESFQELRNKSIRLESIPGPFALTVIVFFEIGFLSMVWLGLYYLANQSLSIPVLITFLIVGYNLYFPLKVLMSDYLLLRYANESLKRVINVLDEPTMETTKNEFPTEYSITFNDVSFGYQDKKVIKNMSFTIPEKSMVALVGASGSGKTTIASLIARFWDVDSGNIEVGGVDIRNIPQDKFYSLISEVFQEVYLFDDTIYNNIKIGNPSATKEEILEASEKAQVLDFVWDELPHGMETRVGEGGSRLSGGQKQRVSIARALLKDAPIVLLDEATASLDPENELHIQKAIQELVKSKTVVVIAHKLATIQNANQILVLDNGNISERGTHKELLEQNGIYRKMWDIQQKSSGWKVKRE